MENINFKGFKKIDYQKMCEHLGIDFDQKDTVAELKEKIITHQSEKQKEEIKALFESKITTNYLKESKPIVEISEPITEELIYFNSAAIKFKLDLFSINYLKSLGFKGELKTLQDWKKIFVKKNLLN